MPNTTPHRRWPTALLIAAAAAGVLVGGLTLALNLAFPPERLAALLSAQVGAATGRDFAVRGEMSIRLFPRFAVLAHDTALGNAAWGTRKDMLLVKQARLDIALWPLLQGRVAIGRVALDGVDLWLETDRAGVGNWVMQGAGAASPQASGQAAGAAPLRVDIDQVHLADARVQFSDGRSGRRRFFDLQQLELHSDGDGQRLDAQFEMQSKRWQLKGPVGRLADLAGNLADWPFDLQLSSDGALLAAKGQLRQGPPPRALVADLSARLTKPAALAGWLAQPAKVPLPIELKARLEMSAQDMRFEALQGAVAEQRFSGRATVQNGAPWKIDAQLASPAIDLARWLPPGAAAKAPAAGERRWLFGTTPIAFDALPAGPASLALRVEALRAPGLPPLSNFNATLNAQPGRFRAEPLSFGMAGGNVRGAVTVALASGAAPRVAVQATASNLSMDALLQASGHAAFARGGQLQWRSDLNLAGITPRALAAGASGELLVSIADTTLGGGTSPLGTKLLPQLLQAITLQSTLPSDARIDCAVLRLPLKNGVAVVDRSIAVETAQFAITAKGQIRLDDETLELAFRPTQKKGLNLSPIDLASLVVLKGPLLDPKVTLDAKGAAGLAVAVGAAGATGGLSLLAERLLRAPSDPQPCRLAATGQAVAAVSAAPRAGTPPPAGQQAPADKALPDLLRRIFK